MNLVMKAEQERKAGTGMYPVLRIGEECLRPVRQSVPVDNYRNNDIKPYMNDKLKSQYTTKGEATPKSEHPSPEDRTPTG